MDNAMKNWLVERGRMLLERFHEADDKNPNGLESQAGAGA
jgi:hypothetical protein